MKFSKTLITAALAAGSLAAVAAPALASPAGPSHASAVQPRTASGWFDGYGHAESGNGCFSMQIVSVPGGTSFKEIAGSPVVSEPCSSASRWDVRDLSSNDGSFSAGDNLEYVTEDKRLALGFSPTGGWELMTPSDSSTYVPIREVTKAGWEVYLNPTQVAGMYPKAAGDQLGAPPTAGAGVAVPPDEWVPCPVSNPTCSPAGIND